MTAQLQQHSDRKRGQEGMALIAALSMLALFALLGSAYVGYMSAEFDTTRYELRNLHAKQIAAAGVHAGIGALQQAIQDGEGIGESYSFEIPIYNQQLEADIQQVVVNVLDESSRINLNLAPREVLEAIGFERSQVRDLKRMLPRPDATGDDAARWLTSLGDLRARGVIGPDTISGLDPNLITFVSANPASAEGYLNLNTAPPGVLAAVLNTTLEEAQAIAEKRPFSDWGDVVNKAGKPETTFNIAPETPGEMPAAITLNSRTFRLESIVEVPVHRSGARAIRHRVEAVVALRSGGQYEMLYWREQTGRSEEIESPLEVESVEPDIEPEDISMPDEQMPDEQT